VTSAVTSAVISAVTSAVISAVIYAVTSAVTSAVISAVIYAVTSAVISVVIYAVTSAGISAVIYAVSWPVALYVHAVECQERDGGEEWRRGIAAVEERVARGALCHSQLRELARVGRWLLRHVAVSPPPEFSWQSHVHLPYISRGTSREASPKGTARVSPWAHVSQSPPGHMSPKGMARVSPWAHVSQSPPWAPVSQGHGTLQRWPLGGEGRRTLCPLQRPSAEPPCKYPCGFALGLRASTAVGSAQHVRGLVQFPSLREAR